MAGISGIMWIVAALAGISGLVVAFNMLRTPRAALPVLSVMVMLSAFSVHRTDTGMVDNHTWLQPVQLYRSELFAALAVVVLGGTLVHVHRLRLRNVSSQGVLLVLIQIYAGILTMYHMGLAEGGKRSVFAVLGYGAVLAALSICLREPRDWLLCIRAVALGLLMWLGASMVQMLIDPTQMLANWNTRFTGMSGNPQGTAIFLGPACAVVLWLALNDPNRRLKLVWYGATAAGLICIVWTGSRTGAALFVLGAMAALYGRAGRAVVALPVVAAFIFVGLKLASGMDETINYERVLSTENTRAEVWSILLADAMRSPLIGSPMTEMRASENSYLLSVVLFGIGCLLLILVMMAISGWVCLKLWMLRKTADPLWRRIIELIIGYNVMYFAGAMFEGYIVARLEANIMFMLFFGAMGTALLRRAEEVGLEEFHSGYVPGESDAFAYGDVTHAEPVQA